VLVVIALALALVVKTFVVQAFFIPSGSMQNTLAINDRVLVNKLVYHFRGIDRGDIVVFNGEGSWDFGGSAAPSNPVVRFVDAVEGVVGITHGSDVYIKRVIGLPGDTVACCNLHGQVTVNGVALFESSYLYPGNPPSQQKFSIKVPPGRLWVMGDHRDVSYDSRGHMGDPGGGTIPQSAVLGRAFVIVWPPSQWAFLNIPATFEQPALTSASAAGGSTAALAAALRSDKATVAQSWSPLPLAAGVTGALPLTWLQRRARIRRARRRRSRSMTRAELPRAAHLPAPASERSSRQSSRRRRRCPQSRTRWRCRSSQNVHPLPPADVPQTSGTANGCRISQHQCRQRVADPSPGHHRQPHLSRELFAPECAVSAECAASAAQEDAVYPPGSAEMYPAK
jgi:signal peptidase I